MPEELTPKQQAHEKARKKRERELSDIREVVKTPAGRRFYYRIYEECKPFHTPFCGDETNRTHVNIGKREIGLTFHKDLVQADPEAMILMQREQGSADKHEEIERKERIENYDHLKPSA